MASTAVHALHGKLAAEKAVAKLDATNKVIGEVLEGLEHAPVVVVCDGYPPPRRARGQQKGLRVERVLRVGAPPASHFPLASGST